MSQDRKYFGMTTQQIGILAGLGALACLLFGVMGILFLRRGSSGLFSQALESTPAVRFTATPFVIPTTTPTATPTPIPYDELIPSGWVQHKTGLSELWLPSNFKTSRSGTSSGISGNSVLLDMAFQSSSESSLYTMSVSVSYEPLTTSTLEEFVDLRLSNVPAEINIAERRKVSINSVDAYRLMFERHQDNVYTDDLLFVFQDGGTIWYVEYIA